MEAEPGGRAGHQPTAGAVSRAPSCGSLTCSSAAQIPADEAFPYIFWPAFVVGVLYVAFAVPAWVKLKKGTFGQVRQRSLCLDFLSFPLPAERLFVGE